MYLSLVHIASTVIGRKKSIELSIGRLTQVGLKYNQYFVLIDCCSHNLFNHLNSLLLFKCV